MEANLRIFFLVLVLTAFALAQKDPICKNEPEVSGDCKESIRGYTFSESKNRCKSIRVEACMAKGNFFRTRDGCRSKCMGNSPSEESGFMAIINRTLSQIQSLLSGFIHSVF